MAAKIRYSRSPAQLQLYKGRNLTIYNLCIVHNNVTHFPREGVSVKTRNSLIEIWRKFDCNSGLLDLFYELMG